MAKFYAEVEFEVSGIIEPAEADVGFNGGVADVVVESMSLVAYDTVNKRHVSIPLDFKIPADLADALLKQVGDEIEEAISHDSEEM